MSACEDDSIPEMSVRDWFDMYLDDETWEDKYMSFRAAMDHKDAKRVAFYCSGYGFGVNGDAGVIVGCDGCSVTVLADSGPMSVDISRVVRSGNPCSAALTECYMDASGEHVFERAKIDSALAVMEVWGDSRN